LTADVQVKSISKVTELGAFLVVKKPPSKENIQDALSKAEERLR
jgi:two-component system, chemotaxis family, chemotaxis protein CheY